MKRLLYLLFGTLLVSSAKAGETLFYRIVSTQSTEILSLSVTDSLLSWTNTSVPSLCAIEVSTHLTDGWNRVSYPVASNALTSTTVPTNRNYRLGFTPFPYTISTNYSETLAMFTNVYDVIERDADMICYHFDGGVPWPEALSNQPYSSDFDWDINFRIANKPPGHKVYMALTPISVQRDRLAPYWGESRDLPLPTPWDTYAFNHPNVKTAYLNHCNRMISLLQPDWLVIGVEVNLLKHLAPEKWEAYVELHTETYAALKAAHPDLSLSVSLIGMHLIEGYTEVDHAPQMAAFNEIMPYSDLYALSLHCFLSSLLAETVPSRDLLRSITALSDKPMVIAETSYPAEAFTINSGTVAFNGSPEKQVQYFENLLSVLDEENSLFVINFVTIDYDGLWEWMGQPDGIDKVWRDTGLYDEGLTNRPALNTWRGKLFLPIAE